MLPSARNDLLEIIQYLSHFYKNTAIKKYDKIIEKINGLKQFPFRYEEYKTSVSDYNYRRIVVDEYMVFYVILDDKVEIHNIINSKMDLSKII